MNLEHYRNYVAIVEAGSLSAAALKQHIAQPALTNQLKHFEETFGATLFVRNTRQMELTDAGKILYDKAKHMIYLEDAAYKEISACVKGIRGTLCLGITQAYPDPFFEDLLIHFHEENPDIQFTLYEASSNDLIDLLKDGVIEVGIIRTSRILPPILTAHLSFTEQMMVSGRRDNPWVSPDQEEIHLEELKNIPLSITPGVYKRFTDACQRSGFTPQILSISTSRTNALMWAEHGHAFAVITTDNAAQYETDALFCRPILTAKGCVDRNFLCTRAVTTLKEGNRSAVALHFLDFCRQYHGLTGEETEM